MSESVSGDAAKAKRRTYYLANRERIKIANRLYYQRHRERYLEQFHQRDELHRDETRAKKKARYHTDPEPQKMSSQQYRRDNHEIVKVKDAARAQKARLASPWKELLHAARWRARKKNVPFELTNEWAAARWTGRCEVSGFEFSLGQRTSGPKFFSPSIDRIDAIKGYVSDNCRFVLWAVNSFKHDATDADMLLVARAIVARMG